LYDTADSLTSKGGEVVLKVLCIGESIEATREVLKLRDIGCSIIISPSSEVVSELLGVNEFKQFNDFKLIIVVDGVGDREVGMRDIQHIRQSRWQDGPIIFLSPEDRESFNFNFNEGRVEFIKTPISVRDMAEVIARIADE